MAATMRPSRHTEDHAMNTLFTVNAKAFAAVSMFTAVSDVRPYLCGVFIKPHKDGGAEIVATDGHTLACAHDPNGQITYGNELVRAEARALEQCRLKGSDRIHFYDCSNFGAYHASTVLSEVTGVRVHHISKAHRVDRNDRARNETGYVDYERLLDYRFPTEPSPPQAVNPHLLGRIMDAGKVLMGNVHEPIWTLPSRDKNDTIRAFMKAGDITVKFLVMPLRADTPEGMWGES